MTTWSMVEFEADDALATAALRYAEDERVEEVLICSPDKDLCQLLEHPKLKTYDRMRDRLYDRQAVIEKFGVEPRSIPDFLALVGDAADGIPGLSRWGAKSSATVLSHFGTIEDIPDEHERWMFKVRGAVGLSEVLREHRTEALLYKKLATLRHDVPLKEELDDLCWQGPDTTSLETLCKELGMSNVPRTA
jgi:5'-3' exonuclease